MTGHERCGPLSSGQHYTWVFGHFLKKKMSTTKRLDVDLPLETSEEQVRSALEHLFLRHESLRTRFTPDATGRPVQEVFSVAHAMYLVRTLREEQWPSDTELRSACVHVILVKSAEHVERVVFFLDEAIADGVGISVVYADFRSMLTSLRHGTPVTSTITWHPLDQAESENSPKTAAAYARALEHWQKQARGTSHTTVPFYWNHLTERQEVVETDFTSPEVGDSCRVLAQRIRVSEPAVLASVLSLLISRWIDSAHVTFSTPFSNRAKKHLQGSVGRYTQTVDVSVHVDQSASFSQLAAHTFAASIAAYQQAGFDRGKLAMMLAEESARRGARNATSLHFNFHEYLRDAAAWEASSNSAFRQNLVQDGWPFPLMHVYPGKSAYHVLLRCSREILPERAQIDFLSHFRTVLCHLANNNDRICDIPAQPSLPRIWTTGRWCKVSGAWVSLDDIDKYLSGHPSVEACRTFFLRDDQRHRWGSIVSCVVDSSGVLTDATLRDYLRVVASDFPTTVVPSTFVIRREAPNAPHHLESWVADRAVHIGSGTMGHRREPQNETEAAVARVFRLCHPQARVDMSLSYAESAGDFLAIPRMQEMLAHEGYSGLRLEDFLGLSSLRGLAMKLAGGCSWTGSGKP
jgi:hypothetical protein